MIVRRAALPTLAVLVLTLVSGGALAKAKPGRYVVDAKGETVLDTITKLTWQRDGQVAGSLSWLGAGAYCAGLTVGGGGWRLPTVVELRSLVDRGVSNPVTDKAAFPLTNSDWYWSATKYHASQSSAWFVGFGNGTTDGDGTSNKHSVRCVR